MPAADVQPAAGEPVVDGVPAAPATDLPASDVPAAPAN